MLSSRHGINLNRKTVAKLMKEEGLKAKGRRKDSYSSYKGTVGKVAPNHLERNFFASRPFEKLVSDITQFNIGESKVYLSPLIDLYNGEVISWKTDKRPSMAMVLDMLSGVYPSLCKHKPIIHTDQGVHYQAAQWQIMLRDAGCIQSMSRKGNCLDNAAAESFFGKVKTEFSNGKEYKNPDTFIKDLNEYIHWYNEIRIKESLSGRSPIEYRKMENPPTSEHVQV